MAGRSHSWRELGAGVPARTQCKLGVQGREGPGCTEHSERGRVVGAEAERPGRARQGLTGLRQELGFWFACDQRPLEYFLVSVWGVLDGFMQESDRI